MDGEVPPAGRSERKGKRGLLKPALLTLLVAIGVAVAIPYYIRWQYSRNFQPHNSLRSLVVAQEQFRQQVVVDQDKDQQGEFGWLGELAGVQAVRGSGLLMSTSPFIAAILGVKDQGGRGQKSGHYFQMWLQDGLGNWGSEPVGPENYKAQPGSGAWPLDAAAADHQERRWICYSWPSVYGQSGASAYVVDQIGRLWRTKYEPGVGAGGPYSGAKHGPLGLAAFTADGSRIADGTTGERGQDGRLWVPARG